MSTPNLAASPASRKPPEPISLTIRPGLEIRLEPVVSADTGAPVGADLRLHRRGALTPAGFRCPAPLLRQLARELDRIADGFDGPEEPHR